MLLVGQHASMREAHVVVANKNCDERRDVTVIMCPSLFYLVWKSDDWWKHPKCPVGSVALLLHVVECYSEIGNCLLQDDYTAKRGSPKRDRAALAGTTIAVRLRDDTRSVRCLIS